MTYLVTGGAGFIGSAVVRMLVERGVERVVNVDKLTYAGNLDSLASVASAPNYALEQNDICDATEMRRIFAQYQPTAVIHLAAESHVDRSIDGPSVFVETNIVGTFTLLQEARRFWTALGQDEAARFRFLYVSTDEVFGSLGQDGFFVEETPYDPNSPYAASKAAADHLVRAWHRTYGLPCILTNCSNNFGPFQFPEKLMPLIILNGILGAPLPVYGKGENIRDWLYVDDHARALLTVLERGETGQTYLISGRNERRNIDVVRAICGLLDELAPDVSVGKRESLIKFVTDRPGHDHRYAIDPAKIERDLNWRPQETFDSALRNTVRWYLENREWWERVRAGTYRGERLGLGTL